MDTGTRHFGELGPIWIPVPPVPVEALIPAPNTSVTGTGTDFDTGTQYFGRLSTTSTPLWKV